MAENSDSLDENKKDEPEKASEKQASQTLSSEAFATMSDSAQKSEDTSARASGTSDTSATARQKDNPFARDSEQDKNSVLNNGFPDLSIDFDKADGPSSKSAASDARTSLYHQVADISKTSGEQAKVEEAAINEQTEDQPSPELDILAGHENFSPDLSFPEGTNIILMGDDHKGRYAERFNEEVLRNLREQQGLSHVALEFVPGTESMRRNLEEYRRVKEELEKAKAEKNEERIKELEAEKERLRARILAEIEKHFPVNGNGERRAGEMTPAAVLDQIDTAHRAGVDVVGLEPPAAPELRQSFRDLKNDNSPEGENARRNFVRFFANDAEGRKEAETELENYYRRSGLSEQEVQQRMQVLRDAREQGFKLEGTEKFPTTDDPNDPYGDLDRGFMHMRDQHFAKQITGVADKGGRILAFAGEMHFTHMSTEIHGDLAGWRSTSNQLNDRGRHRHRVVRSTR